MEPMGRLEECYLKEAQSMDTGRTLRLLPWFGVKVIQDEFTGRIPTEGENSN